MIVWVQVLRLFMKGKLGSLPMVLKFTTSHLNNIKPKVGFITAIATSGQVDGAGLLTTHLNR